MIVLIQKAGVYIFDEPTSYLDVKQRIKMAKLVRGIQTHDNYIILVEHDLSILDYLSDFICCLYGEPGAYGVVTMPFTVREGINIFLAGFVPTENMRFRDEELSFHISDTFEEIKLDKSGSYKYPKVKIIIIPDVQEARRLRAHNLRRIIQDFPDYRVIGRERYRKDYIYQDAG